MRITIDNLISITSMIQCTKNEAFLLKLFIFHCRFYLKISITAKQYTKHLRT